MMPSSPSRQACGRVVEQAGKERLAVDQGRVGELVAAEVEQVEGVIDHPVGALRFELLLQAGEARDAARALDDDLAVDERGPELQRLEGLGEAPELDRPVEPFAGQELDLAAIDPRLQAITVELDLVHPFAADRRMRGERREARLVEGRQDALSGAGHAGEVRRRARALACDFGALGVIGPDFAAGRKLVVRPLGEHRGRLLGRDLGAAWRAREPVVGLQQEPLLLLLARFRPRAHEVPSPLQAPAFEREGEMALLVAGARIAFRRPAAFVPNDHRAAAILALRDDALEGEVFERMVLGMDRKALLAEGKARPARDGPALQHPVELEPQIVVEAAGIVLLHAEAVAGGGLRAALRLRGAGEVALAAIGKERFWRGIGLRLLLGERLPRTGTLSRRTLGSFPPAISDA